MIDYVDRRVTSPTWGPPPPCKQALVVLDTGRKELFIGVKGSRAGASINECKNFTYYIDDNLANFIQLATFV